MQGVQQWGGQQQTAISHFSDSATEENVENTWHRSNGEILWPARTCNAAVPENVHACPSSRVGTIGPDLTAYEVKGALRQFTAATGTHPGHAAVSRALSCASKPGLGLALGLARRTS